MANQVRFGVNAMELNFAGDNAAAVATTCRRILCLSGEETMKVNGRPVTADQIIRDGDSIEFVKDAGTKGSEVSVTVQYGVNRVQVTVNDGATVRQVLAAAASILGVDLSTGTPVMNGARCTGDTVVVPGAHIECQKTSGTKGGEVSVTVQYGVNRVQVTVNDGATVRQVLAAAASILGVDLSTGTPVMNGARCTGDTIVVAGAHIECQKTSGTKGR